ncbi:MAG: hypothetical protein RIT81_35815 [Deltaproteobacteria bacterium]
MSLALLGLLAAATVGRVAIIPIVGTDDRVQTSHLVRPIAQAVDERNGLSAMSIDDLFSSDGTALVTAIKRCGTDNNCVRRSVRDYGADFAVVVVVNRRVSPPVAQIQLVPGAKRLAKAGSRLGNLTRREDEAATLRRLTAELLGEAGFVRSAAIDLVVDPPDATILLDDVQQVTAAQHQLEVAPGPHRIEARRDGYQPFAERRELAEGETWLLRPKLEEAPTSLLTSPWFWIVSATVVVAGAVAVAVVAQPPDKTVIVCLEPNCDDS